MCRCRFLSVLLPALILANGATIRCPAGEPPAGSQTASLTCPGGEDGFHAPGTFGIVRQVHLDRQWTTPNSGYAAWYVASLVQCSYYWPSMIVIGEADTGGESPDPAAESVMDYYFMVSRKHPGAPSDPVPVCIQARGFRVLDRSAYADAWIYWDQGDGEELLASLGGEVSEFDVSHVRSVDVGIPVRIRMKASCRAIVGSFDVYLDPVTSIAGDAVVNVDGTNMPAREAYELIYSDGFGPRAAPETILTTITRCESGVSITVPVEWGWTYTVETSCDLINWTNAVCVDGMGSNLVHTCNGSGPHFFRTRTEPANW